MPWRTYPPLQQAGLGIKGLLFAPDTGENVRHKAIETVYNGYRFRSRLEARWAVFFDTLGVKYEYEKEGYELDGVRYLPDFWIPEWECFVEIKADEASDEEWLKCFKLWEATGNVVMLIRGNPWPGEHTTQFPLFPDNDQNVYHSEFASCMMCEGFVVVTDRDHLEIYHLSGPTCGKYRMMTLSRFSDAWGDEVRAAYSKARQARFEHGEKP